MAVPVIEGWTTTSATASSITLTKPTGVVDGDLLLIVVMNDDLTNTAQWDASTYFPTGFTFINESGDNLCDCHTAAFWRIADGTAGSTIGVSAESSDNYVGFYFRISGAHATTPIHQVGADSNTTSATTGVITEVTTTVDDCLCLAVVSTDGATLVPADSVSGSWSTADGITNELSGVGAEVATQGKATAGATGDCTFDWTGAGSNGSSGFQIAIAPAAGTSVTGTAAFSIPIPTMAATGVSSTAVAGTSSFTIPLPTMAATGNAIGSVTGTSEVTIPVPVMSASGQAAHTGTSAFAIPIPTMAASGESAHTGSSSFTIPMPTMDASGTHSHTGTGEFTIPMPTMTADGSHSRTGTGAFSIPMPAMAASGVSSTSVTGTAAFTIPAPTTDAIGSLNGASGRRHTSLGISIQIEGNS